MDKHLKSPILSVICPACKIISFDPKICYNCGNEIPSCRRIRMINQRNKVFEVTGIEKVSKYTFPALFEASSSKEKTPKCDVRYAHDENCACVQYLKTEEEVKNSWRTEEDEEKEHAEESYHPTTEKHKSNSMSTCSMVHPDRGFVSIYKEDVACLDDGKELNDNIIDFYLNYVYHEIIPQEFKAVTHIFSACFNKFLMTVFEEKNTTKSRSEIEKNVQKWVKNVDIFSKDFIFVPINRHEHWYLAVLCFISQLNKNSDEGGESSKVIVLEDNAPDARTVDHPYFKKGKPCICFFDSLDKRSTLVKEKLIVAGTLKKFLSVLWDIKNPSKPYDWDNLLCIKAVSPQQNNTVDCGLYLLQYVESFFKDPIPSFENPMPTLKNWFPKSCISNKRKQIKDVIPEKVIKKPKTLHSNSSDVVALSS